MSASRDQIGTTERLSRRTLIVAHQTVAAASLIRMYQQSTASKKGARNDHRQSCRYTRSPPC
ncbi:hypothetical protein M3J09_010832 [Ascochyta lentis]